MNIINENGEVLLKEEEMDSYEIIESEENKKLVVYKQNSNALDNKNQTVVYAILPHERVENFTNSSQPANSYKSKVHWSF